MRTFTFTDDKSNKFWNIELKGKSFTVTFGRIGSAGQTQIKEFADEAAAKKEHDKLVTEKLKKGYVETTPGGSSPAPEAKPAPAAKSVANSVPAPAAPAATEPPSAGGLRTFAFSDATSHKFWNIEISGAGFTVTYGRQGSAGQTQIKTFPNETAAKKEHAKLVTEKLKKGYVETTPTARPAPTSLRESLELALVEKPDDLATHMAYADYLGEQGDPLGEFIRVQLQLEDPSKSPDERTKLQQHEQKLLKTHGRMWLGDLAPFLLDKKKKNDWDSVKAKFTFARGWLDTLEVNSYNVAFSRALARSPQARLLRRLALAHNLYEEEGEYEAGEDIPEGADSPQLYPLVRSPYLSNVRVLVVGEPMTPEEEDEASDGGFNCQTQAAGVVGLVKLMPKLEELYLLAQEVDADQLFSLKTLHHLRILQLYHNRGYPLARLAKNPSLGKLTHLLCHPHAMDDEDAYIRLPGVKAVVRSPEIRALTHLRLRLSDMGDGGVKEIVASGVLKRLKVLDLRHGCITDEGARRLAACPDVKNLELLDLTHNNMTEAGIQALQATGVKLEAGNQWVGSGDEWGDREYLFAGDIE